MLYKQDNNVPDNRRSHYYIEQHEVWVNIPADQVAAKAEFKGLATNHSLTAKSVRGVGDGANNLHTFGNSVVYNVAGVGVVLDVATGGQLIMTEHSSDVLCINIHAGKALVASGLDAKGKEKPHITICSLTTGQELKRFIYHQRAILALAFSLDGTFLFTVGGDDNQTLAVWAWETAPTGKASKPLATLPCAKMTGSGGEYDIQGIWMLPSDKDCQFVTLGRKHFGLWSWNGKELSNQKVSTYDKTKVLSKIFDSAAASGPSFFVHSDTGHIIKMSGKNVIAAQQIFGPGSAVLINTPDGISAVGPSLAGKSGLVASWTVGQLEGEKFPPPSTSFEVKHSVEVDAVAGCYINGKLAVTMWNRTIVEIDQRTGVCALLVDGHNGDVDAVAVHPTQRGVFATGSDDKSVKIWGVGLVASHTVPMKDAVRTLQYSPSGEVLVAGLLSGSVALLNAATGALLAEVRVTKEEVSALAFSLDGRALAVGSHDSSIYLVDPASLATKLKMSRHSSNVEHLQFSSDGKFLMSDSRDYEILFWNAESGSPIMQEMDVIDAQFPNWRCFLGWPVEGIWADTETGTDLHRVSQTGDLLAVGDDYGKVRLYQYPVLGKAQRKDCNGHSSHVMDVAFSADGGMCYSAGGDDFSSIEWVVA